MKCTRITFEGFKRLADADCNVSPRLLAFVGQNEAGKSSVLQGLFWLTENGERPLKPLDACRSNKKKAGWVVGAFYDFDEDDLAVLEPLGFKDVPTRMSLWKQVDGSLNVVFESPRDPQRCPRPFEDAASAMEAALTRLSTQIAAAVDEHEEDDGPADWFAAVTALLGDPDHEWTDTERNRALRLADWLSEKPSGRKRARDDRAAGLLRTAAQIGFDEHPNETGIELMRKRVPKFVMFEDDDRDLPTVTAVNTPEARQAIRPALDNLLAIAELDAATLWEAHADGDSGEVRTVIDEGNAKLDAFFMQAWNQSNVSVRLALDAHGLHAHIYEIDTKRYTRIEERSDGLRAFIALAAFLEAQHLDVPPIVLIDEAETHLHFDAQADLVGVLLKQVRATQIFYTTHSPGCLPSDLGTGIRLLKRTGAASEIVSHFWTNEAPGFGSLLFAMGAGAAAFSVCRWAVLAEGASEMILLPTLLREANKIEDLSYQVAPGLSNARAYGMNVEEVAAKVVYLVDGDDDGKRYRQDLDDAKVNPDCIFDLPPGKALEDLLDPAFYLDVVAKMLPKGAPTPTADIVAEDEPIGLSLSRWAKEQSVDLPGKVAMAYAVLDREDVVLAADATDVLRDLHVRFLDAFERRGLGSTPAD